MTDSMAIVNDGSEPQSTPDDLVDVLVGRTKDNLRCVFEYGMDGCDVLYRRDDVSETELEYLALEIKTHPQVVGIEEATPRACNTLRSTIRTYDQVVTVHLVSSTESGIVATLEPDATPRIRSFTRECLSRLA